MLTADLAVGAGIADAEIAPAEQTIATSGLVLTTDDIVVPDFRVGERSITATVEVAYAEAGTVLDAWVDFDGDGSFGGVRERIAAARPVSSGEQTLRFDAPATTASGTIPARFRLSTPDDPSAEPVEQVVDLTVLPPNEEGVVFTNFAEDRVFAEVDGNTRVVEVIDFDGDGDTDLVTTLYGTVYWQEQTDEGYVNHIIWGEPGGIDGVGVVDIDADGDLDLVTVSGRDPILLHLNDGTRDFSTRVELAVPGELVLRLPLVGDIDADGDYDLVVYGCSHGCDMFWYEQAGAEWVLHTFPIEHPATPNALIDADGDGDLDLFTGGGSVVRAYEFDDAFLAPRDVAESPDRIYRVAPGDVDGDGDIDFLVHTGEAGAILENLGEFRFEERPLTTERLLTDRFHPLQLVDLTGDGLPEAVYYGTVVRIADGAVLGFVPGDRDFGGIFEDVDQDGDLDIVAAQWDFDSIYWLEHVGDAVSLRQTDYRVDFAETFSETFSFRVERIANRSEPVEGPPIRVEFAFTGGATLGEDFVIAGADEVTNAGGYFTIPADERDGGFELTLLDDDCFELDETLRITFVENGEYAVRARYDSRIDRYIRHRDITIIDDDPGDFGDAPAFYNVDRERGGAKHGVAGPRLGVRRDAEADGAPSSSAEGEGADDDGVTFGALRAGQRATVTVQVTGATEGAFVDAWIDFDRDGQWGPLEDLILASAPVVNGDNRLTFTVPAGVKPGETFARVRLSESGGLSPYGSALTGEVEDYAVTLSPAPRGTGVFRRPVELPADEYERIWTVAPADIDGDGDQDLVVSGSRSWVTWWSNDGEGGFRREATIDSGEGDPFNYDNSPPDRLDPIDFDRDGDIDLIGSGYFRDHIRLYENTPTGFLIKELSSDFRKIAGVSDVDRDGEPDLHLGNSYLRNAGDGGFVETGATALFYRDEVWELTGTVLTDLDHDGQLDAVALREDEVRWYTPNDFGRYLLKETVKFSVDAVDEPRLIVADTDEDPFPEVIALSGRISTLIVGVDAEGRLEAEIDPGLPADGLLAFADLNADGDLDLISNHTPGGFGWFSSQPDSDPLPITLGDRIGGQSGVFSIDADLDGDLDLISWGGRIAPDGSGIFVHEQVDNTVQVVASHAAVSEGDLQHVTFTARRTGPLGQAITVPYTLSGTADVFADYVFLDPLIALSTSGFLRFAPGQSEVSFRVMATPDGTLESNELLTFAIGQGGEYRVGEADAVTLILVDDELADYGDAPAPYATVRFQDGPRHRAIGPKLGSARQAEPDGAPATDADADDDGLAGHGLRVGATDSYLLVDVSAAPLGARLDAWIDFDGDGAWAGADERVASGLAVVNGRNAVVFTTPPTAKSGPTYARLRISTAGGLGLLGAAPNGEVEDHRVVIDAPAATLGVFGQSVEAEHGAFNNGNLLSHDLDGDGDLDFIQWEVSYSTYFVRIENRGADGFFRHDPVVIGRYIEPRELVAGDITGNGVAELMVRTYDELIVFAAAPDGYTELARKSLRRASSHSIAAWVRLADVDSDGRVEILVASTVDRFPGLDAYRYDVGVGLVGERLAEGLFLAPAVADLNGDGRADIVTAYQGPSRTRPGSIVYLQRGPDGVFRQSDSIEASGFEPTIVDFDGDGDPDIVYRVRNNWYFGGRQIPMFWLSNEGDGGFEPHPLLSTTTRVDSFQVADLNGDGLPDLLVEDNGTHGGYDWYPGVGGGELGMPMPMSNAEELLSARVADFDGDGDLDLVAGGVANNNLLWAPNLTSAAGDYNADGVIDANDEWGWRWHYGSTHNLRADFNGNGVVDAADYSIWRDNVGSISVVTDTTRVSLDERMEGELRPPARALARHRPQVRARFRAPDPGPLSQRITVVDEQDVSAASSAETDLQQSSTQNEERLARVDAAFARLAVRPQLRAAFRRL